MATSDFIRHTRQRQVILEELQNTDTHPTAAELHGRVRVLLPRISLGTVYRNLELLVKNGMARKLDSNPLETGTITIERQCDVEYLEGLDDLVKDADAVVSIACSVGPQYVAFRYPYVPVYPGLNTTFIGGAAEHGVWKEYCQACGNCIIGEFGGLCPITRCAKQLLNGPCGGSSGGKCEVGKGTIDCVWHLIYERLKNLGKLQRLEDPELYKDWSTSRDGGPRTMIREELRK